MCSATEREDGLDTIRQTTVGGRDNGGHRPAHAINEPVLSGGRQDEVPVEPRGNGRPFTDP